MSKIVSIALRGGLDLLHALPPIHDPELAQRRPISGHTYLGDFGLCTELSGFLEIPCTAYFGVGIPGRVSNSHFILQRVIGRLDTDQGWLNQYSKGNITSSIDVGNALGYEHVNNDNTVSFAPVAAPLHDIAATYTGELSDIARRAAESYAHLSGASEIAGTGLAVDLAKVSKWVDDGVDFQTVAIDHLGYDTHAEQQSRLHGLLTELNTEVTAFAKKHPEVTIVITSEFGRRIDFNSANGTDHGEGGAMFIIGPDQGTFSIEHKYTTLDNRNGNVPISIDMRPILQNL